MNISNPNELPFYLISRTSSSSVFFYFHPNISSYMCFEYGQEEADSTNLSHHTYKTPSSRNLNPLMTQKCSLEIEQLEQIQSLWRTRTRWVTFKTERDMRTTTTAKLIENLSRNYKLRTGDGTSECSSEDLKKPLEFVIQVVARDCFLPNAICVHARYTCTYCTLTFMRYAISTSSLSSWSGMSVHHLHKSKINLLLLTK